MKSHVRKIVHLCSIAVVAYVAYSFVGVVISARFAAATATEHLRADRIIRAFSTYPATHEGRYPTFRNSDEVTRALTPLLETEASKLDNEGLPRTTNGELQTTSRGAAWNLSLSGARQLGDFDPSPRWPKEIN